MLQASDTSTVLRTRLGLAGMTEGIGEAGPGMALEHLLGWVDELRRAQSEGMIGIGGASRRRPSHTTWHMVRPPVVMDKAEGRDRT